MPINEGVPIDVIKSVFRFMPIVKGQWLHVVDLTILDML